MPGENAFLDQPFTEFDPVIVVDVEQDDGDRAHGRATDEVSSLPAEMLRLLAELHRDSLYPMMGKTLGWLGLTVGKPQG